MQEVEVAVGFCAKVEVTVIGFSSCKVGSTEFPHETSRINKRPVKKICVGLIIY